MWHLTVSLSFLNWIKNEMIFLWYGNMYSEIWQKFISFHFYDCINTIYQFIQPFLDNKISIFEDYGTFNSLSYLIIRTP